VVMEQQQKFQEIQLPILEVVAEQVHQLQEDVEELAVEEMDQGQDNVLLQEQLILVEVAVQEVVIVVVLVVLVARV
jgi:hypothetical protein